MTKIKWGESDPEEQMWFKACEGEGCLTIMELPFERYKNIRYCPACQEILRQKNRRDYMKKKRLDARSLAYGDIASFDEIQG